MVYLTTMDLTSQPLDPFTLSPKQVAEKRIALAKAADLYRMEGKYVKAEKLYLQAAQVSEAGAAKHLTRCADHCRQIYENMKPKPAKKAVKAKTKKAR